MEQTAAPKNHAWRTAAVIACVVLGILNAGISLVAVALAVPGNGSPGSGFTVICMTFLMGNLVSFACAAPAAWQSRGNIRVLGLLGQILTIPLCMGAVVAIMYWFGIDNL